MSACLAGCGIAREMVDKLLDKTVRKREDKVVGERVEKVVDQMINMNVV